MKLENYTTQNFGFSAMNPNDTRLGGAEYTLVTLVVDDSGSIYDKCRDMEKLLKTVLESCRSSPRADNLMIRLVIFNSKHRESHGFKLLSDINPADYDNVLKGTGSTSLFDSMLDSLEAMNKYGKELISLNYDVNGIMIVVTDGDDNTSRMSLSDVKKEHNRATQGENLESLVSILIGVDTGAPGLQSYLDRVKSEAGLSQFEWMGTISAKSLAKLAKFVSQSISSQSKALGTGSPSQSLTF